jgi:inorganic pyrophosphatase
VAPQDPASPVKVGAFASSRTIWAVIETPAGGRVKYSWDPEAGAYRAGRILPLGMVFPFDFGFIPGTKADDGDPLDVLVLADAPLAVGVLVECRVLGAYKVRMSKHAGGSKVVRNDRMIAVPTKTLRGAQWHSLRDLGRPLVDEIEEFFETYVERQGRTFELVGTIGPDRAHALIRSAQQR